MNSKRGGRGGGGRGKRSKPSEEKSFDAENHQKSSEDNEDNEDKIQNLNNIIKQQQLIIDNLKSNQLSKLFETQKMCDNQASTKQIDQASTKQIDQASTKQIENSYATCLKLGTNKNQNENQNIKTAINGIYNSTHENEQNSKKKVNEIQDEKTLTAKFTGTGISEFKN